MQTPYYIYIYKEIGVPWTPWYRHTGDLAGPAGALARPRLGPLFKANPLVTLSLLTNKLNKRIARAKVM